MIRKVLGLKTAVLCCCIFMTGCKTERAANNSNVSAGYNEDFAKNQARLINEAALEKAPLSNMPTVVDGNSHKISKQTIPDTSK